MSVYEQLHENAQNTSESRSSSHNIFGFKIQPPMSVFYQPDHFDSKIKFATFDKKYGGDLLKMRDV